MKMTAEKYDVPKANADSHGPTERPPSTNPLTSVACLRQRMPMPTMTMKKTISMASLMKVCITISLSAGGITKAPRTVTFRGRKNRGTTSVYRRLTAAGLSGRYHALSL